MLRPQEQSTTSGYLNVSGVADGGVYSVTQVAGATISDWTSTRAAWSSGCPSTIPTRRSSTARATCRRTTGSASAGGARRRGGAVCWTRTATTATGSSWTVRASSNQPPNCRSWGAPSSLWFKTTSAGQHDLVNTPAATGPYPLRIYIDGGVLTSTMGATSAVSSGLATSPAYADGEWHHVVVTYGKESPGSGSDVHRLYVDGQLKGAGPRRNWMRRRAAGSIWAA